MLCKLALRNVRRRLRDYSVYFLTLVLGVCLFYTFNALEGQSVMVYLASAQNPMVEGILTIMNVFSVFVSAILAGLILYADVFMMKRRKKELATYFLLGLPAGRVSFLLWLENLLIGLLALAAGLVLGVVFSHLLSLWAAGVFALDAGFLRLSLSPKAAGKAALCFGLIFLAVMLFNTINISRRSLIDLINAGKKSEELKEAPLGRSIALFLVGVVLLIIAYAMLLIRGMLAVDPLFFLMLALGTLGTFLFFRSLSGFLLRVCRSRKGIYYRGLNLFILRQFNARIHTNCLSMTAVCLMLLLAIGITASAAGLNDTINALTQEPCDVSVTNYDAGTVPVDLAARLADAGFDPEAEFSAWHTASFYYPTAELGETLKVNALLPLSDYNALMALRGGAPLSPGDLPAVTEERLVAGGTFLSCAVVEDEAVRDLPLRRQVLAANYAGEAEETENRLIAALNQPSFSEGFALRLDSRLITYADTLGSKVLVIFLGLYLGITFLLASAAVLALQQLSQAADNAARYDLLARLGVDRSMADRSVFVQVALAFLLPLALALVHSLVGMTAANDVIAQAGKVDAWAGILAAAGLLTAVYGAYFLATCLGCRRIAAGR